MASVTAAIQGDELLGDMKLARSRPAALKIDLANLRSALPTTPIFAFEGVDDKEVYYSWFCRIAPGLRFEPFLCNGKAQLLSLLEIVERDVNNLRDGVYFYVDRDFDDLRGVAPTEAVFLTSTYSVENCLVSATVLEELLKNDFHCHAHPAVREPVVEAFLKLYADFLLATKELNRRLFHAARLGIKLNSRLPTKLVAIANLTLETVSTDATHSPELVVQLAREPTPAEAISGAEEFDSFDGSDRYRGKFAMIFFLKWLSHLADDRNSASSKNFSGIGNSLKVNVNELSIGRLALMSDLPVGLSAFVEKIPKGA